MKHRLGVGIQGKGHYWILRAVGNLWEVFHGAMLGSSLGVIPLLQLLSGERTVGAKGAEKAGGTLWYVSR